MQCYAAAACIGTAIEEDPAKAATVFKMTVPIVVKEVRLPVLSAPCSVYWSQAYRWLINDN